MRIISKPFNPTTPNISKNVEKKVIKPKNIRLNIIAIATTPFIASQSAIVLFRFLRTLINFFTDFFVNLFDVFDHKLM